MSQDVICEDGSGFNQLDVLALDHIDKHSTAYHSFSYPAAWLSRPDVSLSGLVKAGFFFLLGIFNIDNYSLGANAIGTPD